MYLKMLYHLYHPASNASPPAPAHASHLHSRFDSLPKQIAKNLPAIPNLTAHKGPAWALRIRICWDAQRGQFRARREMWCKQEFPVDTSLNILGDGKKIDSVQDLSHPINQVILTHPVTWRRHAEQRRHLSGLDGTSNRGVMVMDTA